MKHITAKSKSTEDRSSSAYPNVKALAHDLGLSERSTREAIRRGDIPHIRIGRRVVLPRSAIQKWLERAGLQVAV